MLKSELKCGFSEWFEWLHLVVFFSCIFLKHFWTSSNLVKLYIFWISFKGFGYDSSLEGESLLMDKNPAWSEKYSHQESSSDLSTTSSEIQLNARGEKYDWLICFILVNKDAGDTKRLWVHCTCNTNFKMLFF